MALETRAGVRRGGCRLVGVGVARRRRHGVRWNMASFGFKLNSLQFALRSGKLLQ
jgi:hypothetical protein